VARGIYIDDLDPETIDRLGLGHLISDKAPSPGTRYRSPTDKARKGSPLSLREEQVLILIKEGYSYKEIAVKLSLSLASVKTYTSRAICRLGANNALDAVIITLKKKYIGLWDTLG